MGEEGRTGFVEIEGTPEGDQSGDSDGRGETRFERTGAGCVAVGSIDCVARGIVVVFGDGEGFC